MANETWDYRIGSAGLGMTAAAADWLKQGESARRVAEALRLDIAALRAELAAFVAGQNPPGTPGSDAAVEALAARVQDLGNQVKDITDRIAAAAAILDGE